MPFTLRGRSVFTAFKALLVTFAGMANLIAQTNMGTITGLVTDRSTAVLPGVTVTAKNTATGAEAVHSDLEHRELPDPQPAGGALPNHRFQPGFKSWSRTGISLSAGENIRVDADAGRRPGDRARGGHVPKPPQLKTESTEVSTTMEQKLVDQVPLPIAGIGGGMRNAFSIMMMLPQVKSGNGESAWDDFQVGGGQQHDWNVSVDGLSVEMGWRNHVGYMNRLTPPVDSVQEFRIETATFKAEDSRASGGNIGVTTKSGTNELHGSVFDYYQSQRLNANSWLNNKLGRQKSIFHRNDFGANVGGPVYIPKVYNGKNKTWFFFSYEGYRFPSTSGVSQLTLPTQKMVNGDFTDWRSNSGALLPIYDPQSTRSDGKGGFIRDLFPGNIIPQNRLSPAFPRNRQIHSGAECGRHPAQLQYRGFGAEQTHRERDC